MTIKFNLGDVLLILMFTICATTSHPLWWLAVAGQFAEAYWSQRKSK